MVRAIIEGRKTQTRRVVKPQPPSVIEYPPEGRDGWSCSAVLGARDWWGAGKLEWTVGASHGEQPCPVRWLHLLPNLKCPYGSPGDRLWVKETHARVHPGMLQSLDPDPESHEWTTVYRADANGGYVGKLMEYTKWKPSIFMRREFSRITLEIEAVRVERLQEISEEDAVAEGCDEAHLEHTEDCKSEHCALSGGVDDCCGYLVSAKLEYKALWESINGPQLPANTSKRRYARVKRYLDKHPDVSWDANPFVWVIQFRRVL